MPVFQIPQHSDNWFPPEDAFDPGQDIVAVGGTITAARLWAAYQRGIFPWFNPGEEVLWWCPSHRMVLRPAEVHISRSTRNLLNQQRFEIHFNKDFRGVINMCQKIKRRGQRGTWLTDDIKESFIHLHENGRAHCVAAYHDGKLVGGLYGISVGAIFTGESMFSEMSNAGKISFIHLCRRLEHLGYQWVDCQVYNPYLDSLGAYEIPRREFLAQLHNVRKEKLPF